MATIKRLFVFSTSFLSGIATLFIIISLSTEQWIVSDKTEVAQTITSGFVTIKYGLFQGTVKRDDFFRTVVVSSKFFYC